ncbi:MAG: TetR/AcrR family transcriptional regulator [Nitriliruptoraceae bacterium]
MAAKRVRMTAQQRREQLIDVARSLFAAKGYNATSIEEIAEHAGVSKPIVYQHFGGKEGLYGVVVDREVRRLTASIVAAFDAPTPRLIAEQAADAFLGYIEEHEDGFRVLIRDAPIGMTGGSFASVISDIAVRTERELVEEFDERGFDVSTAPMYGLMLVGAVALVGEWWLEHRSMSREQVAAHVVNLLYNGLHDLESRPTTRSLGRVSRRVQPTGHEPALDLPAGGAPPDHDEDARP